MLDVSIYMGTVRALEAPLPVNDRAPAVAVVAGDGVVRRRATSVLAQDGQVVLIQAASLNEVEPEDARRADAVVIACRARADQRAAAIRTARIRLPDAHIIVISTADANGVHKALEAGAHGFVSDIDLVATLAPTVRAVRVGQLVVPPMARASVVRPPLSHREKQTLHLLVLGLTNAEIAQRLYLAESTVKCHLTSIFSKLGVRSRNEAVALVVDRQDGLGLGALRLSGDANEPVLRT
jgi:two-component system NarL family response regulator